LAPASRGFERQLLPGPARACDEERRLDPELARDVGELGQAPADDHRGSRARAYSRKARAARVSLRPVARATTISRTGSSPRTRAAVSVPAARSASIAVREMKVTP